MNNRLVILAGGLSTRMKNSSTIDDLNPKQIEQANQRSKGLIEIGDTGKTLLHYLLRHAKEAGYKTVYIVTVENALLFRETFQNYSGIDIEFVTQYIPKGSEKPLGTADAVFKAMEQFTELQYEQFSVCNSDNLYSSNALKQLRYSDSKNACVAYDKEALHFTTKRVSKFALMQFDEDYNLVAIIEKPDVDKIDDYRDLNRKIRISMNAFAFDGEMSFPFFKNCPVHPKRNEKEIPTVITNMLKEYPNCMKGIPLAEHVPDLTSKQDILKMNTYLSHNFGA